ncbi:MAG: cob(I)yrinic acid a,c-diamide adenosyltransferase [Propionibacteriaceae bacterium]|jgi:cob(I)alamin adenosyltransferase|nr:cob(I)yrinic acid a,c-diamide adenosyltransferase [Propionibacteriaceae bacterium]
MVQLTRIYTKTGDVGQTRLVNNELVDKADDRVGAYGAVDELNAVIGLALADGGLTQPVAEVLALIQQELFDLGADLANPVDPAAGPTLRVEAAQVERLERFCDEFGAALAPLRSFILPGGSPAGAALHLARTVCRRAERIGWRAAREHGLSEPGGAEASQTAPAGETIKEDSLVAAASGAAPGTPAGGINPVALTYLNRLSDLLFILSRVANGPGREVLWVSDRRPGAAPPA